MLKSDDMEERALISEFLIKISGFSKCLEAVFLGLCNEFINFIENSRTHVGMEEALKIVGELSRRKAIANEDMAVFHHQIILRMAGTRFWGESKEIPGVVRAICRNYPRMASLTIKHLIKIFGGACSITKSTILYIVKEILKTISDETYRNLEDDFCKLTAISLGSYHHLVVEGAAEMLLENHRILSRHRRASIPKIFGPIYRTSKRFWRMEGINKTLRSLYAILEIDHRLFEECLKSYNMRRWKNKWMED
ncbi:Ser/Thr protein phosphatase 2A regulatory subunit beta [Encephalitozoon intestinalis ATCC 50506]|uniref:Ser/Thr protein phosphatase 2A regulatory subunit beta n=1 Tax=Encephalitozoon intestinalis (strain ATCC 50506) TaxID=876142 RepID=E0S6H1_ENCIT|nr:Ser/Thr protein phosphatase 2A regulatory subunit beta [Encephalitozoon intestinalis ATCC 50506]ADM11306.1 Ser/Thr protein phosphatase 2A regulatory subunit beta [Encephalitozoon intestinalis ATCC 50506]UTX44992.1 Ser/Thr protein phosphatase 2A regulatory subunit beta [Encephalitozoon intestinalis]